MNEFKHIGGGAYGEIYEFDGIAIKRFKERSIAFHREVLVNRILPANPHLVRIYSVDYVNGNGQMELYDMSFKDYILDSHRYAARYTEEGKRERHMIIRSIFQGLNCIHACGLVHNDLSDGNVLLRFAKEASKEASKETLTEIQVGISDFGAAVVIDCPAKDSTTYKVCSPDQIISPAHDYYSVGKLIYSMYEPSLVLQSTKGCNLNQIDSVPKEFRRIAVMLLSDDPYQRILAASRFITLPEIKSHVSPTLTSDSRYHNYFNHVIQVYKSDGLTERTSLALLKIQRHFLEKHYDFYFILAFLYLALSIVHIGFDYDLALEEFKMYSKEALKKVEENIRTIIHSKIHFIQLFIWYHF